MFTIRPARILRSTAGARPRRAVVALVAAGASLALTGGVAYATLGSSGDVILACYKSESGVLRVADGMGCRSSEKAVSWNKTGPQGPVGMMGHDGAQGEPGAPGAKGDTGATGPQGPAGADGADGVSGYLLITSGEVFVDGHSVETLAGTCPLGRRVIGGGAWSYDNPGSTEIAPRLFQSAPVSARTWEVKLDNLSSPRRWHYALQIICARAN